MDTHLKERLVGAAVLVAAAVILIPEMLSGPADRPEVTQAQGDGAETGVRTYTIDLAGKPRDDGEPAPVDAPLEMETVAPPPEEVVELPPSSPPSPPPPAVAVPEPARIAEAPARPSAPPAAAQPESPVRSAPPSPANVRAPWAVQVGSFSKPDTAERVGEELRNRGYTVYVVPFKNGTQTLYRVRIGPMQERKAADAAVQKLKAEGTVATVVPNS